jgi:putative transposase
MGNPEELPRSQRWAQLRFAIIGALLAQAPEAGVLRMRLLELSERTWLHPTTLLPVRFSFKTIERWYYVACGHDRPTIALARVVRSDAGRPKGLTPEVMTLLQQSYARRRDWSYLLHYDNLKARFEQRPEAVPSYTTVWRSMRAQGLVPTRHPSDTHDTPSARATRARFANREVRSFQHTHTHALWHIDAHHGGMSLCFDGRMQSVALIVIIDDHSRFIISAQWFRHEHTRTSVHVMIQGIAKHGLPRALLSDNGGPFVAAEVRHGLHRLGILHETTLCYAPNQNGKMEVFWGQVESRLVAMLRGQRDLDLYRLNELTQAWIDHDYHRRVHAGIGVTPLSRFIDAPHTARDAPRGADLMQAFTRRETRRQRRSDGTISLAGRRFQIPSAYRHQATLLVRYANWDLDNVFLTHPETDAILERIHPVDYAANAAGHRAELGMLPAAPGACPAVQTDPDDALPPLLARALAAARATGLPPAFTPLDEEPTPPAPEAPPPTDSAGDDP